jgi:3D (Asp-Asp-Asp) domain-containing protein
MKLLIALHIVVATVYNAVPSQTDSTPLITASNKHIDADNPGKHRWIAVSRDLEKLGFTFGVEVCVENAGAMNGIWVIEDRMNKRFNSKIDFLVDNEIVLGKWKGVNISLNSERK